MKRYCLLIKNYRRIWLCGSVFPLILMICLFGSLALAEDSEYTNEDCISCHDLSSELSDHRIDTNAWSLSVHAAGFKCAGCHTGVTSDYHISKIGSGAVDCVDCHQKRKHHGGVEAGANRPDCVQCHTRHHIFERSNPASSLYVSNLKETCGRCHPDETGQTSYFGKLTTIRIDSHNKQDLSQDYSMDNCFACHQGKAAHGDTEIIEQSSCPDCHMTEEGENAMLGYMHPKADVNKRPEVFGVAVIYQLFLAALFVMGFIWLIQRKRNKK